MDLLFLPNLELVTGPYFHDQNKWIIANVSLCIISKIIINISLLCCKLVKLNHLYYNMFTRTLELFTQSHNIHPTLELFTQSHNIHPLFKQSGIGNVPVFVPLVLHCMIYMFRIKIQLYTIIKI